MVSMTAQCALIDFNYFLFRIYIGPLNQLTWVVPRNTQSVAGERSTLWALRKTTPSESTNPTHFGSLLELPKVRYKNLTHFG